MFLDQTIPVIRYYILLGMELLPQIPGFKSADGVVE